MARRQMPRGETVKGPLTGISFEMPVPAPPRPWWRWVAGVLMGLVAVALTLLALSSPATHTVLYGDLYGFAGWLLGTLIVAGIPWVLTYFLLRKPRVRKVRVDTPRR
ncbi:MAG TPA: hypothetical protein VFN73_12310 [Propionibacteriaceae bacterium]|nr:hypothetical protein [Propionibacteriaceae bacterium]